jgi:peptidoglycan/LPS O-acetylase OafA/YrhL
MSPALVWRPPRLSASDDLKAGWTGRMVDEARSERIQYLDVLRVLSMLSVVFIHSADSSLKANPGSTVWHFANVLTSLASASVPLFFMISGALLLNSPRTDSVCFTLRARLPRVLIPFLLWSLISVAYYLLIGWRADGAFDWGAATDKLKNFRPNQQR